MTGFRITSKKGFHITFPNRLTVSVQFGPGNYCDNYYMGIGSGDEEAGERGSTTAEVAVIDNSNGKLLAVPEFDGDTVGNRYTPEQVLALLNWAASQERVS